MRPAGASGAGMGMRVETYKSRRHPDPPPTTPQYSMGLPETSI